MFCDTPALVVGTDVIRIATALFTEVFWIQPLKLISHLGDTTQTLILGNGSSFQVPPRYLIYSRITGINVCKVIYLYNTSSTRENIIN